MIDFIVNTVCNSITYILPLGNSKECFLIDCGDVEKIIRKGWRIRGVLLTHIHTDHIYGLNELIKMFPNVQIFTNEYGKNGLQDPRLNLSYYHYNLDNIIIDQVDNIRVIDNECTIQLTNELSTDIMFTPGHDPSCITYKIGNCLYTGDSYIPGIKVVTSFPKSDKRLAELSLVRLKEYAIHGLNIMPGHRITNNMTHK